MAAGLQMANSHIFQTPQNRPNIPDVVVLITDGVWSSSGNPVQQADALKVNWLGCPTSDSCFAPMFNLSLWINSGFFLNTKKKFFYGL